MNRTSLIILSLLAVLGASVWQVTRKPAAQGPSVVPLLVHCAAGLREPMTEIARQYEREFGIPIHLQFGGSGALETQLELAGGDLFLPADESYILSTRAKGLVRETLPVTTLTAGIVVPKGNPKNLRSLDDLARPGLRLSLADRSAAIGRHTWAVLEQSARLPDFQANVIVTKPTVNNIVEDVATGAVDATLAWHTVARTFPDVEWLPASEFASHPTTVCLGILTSSSAPARALHFARYLTAADRGLKVFGAAGFTIPEIADEWVDTPELTLFSGSMLRPAIQQRIREFEQREGCRITTVFEGCGTLVAMMKDGGAKPAAYFSCDTKFLDMVSERFGPSTVVSSNRIILLVPKGNPKQLKSLGDLTGPGLKLGLCDPEKSALGYLTRLMLERSQLGVPLDQSGNIALLSGKGDDLVNAMQARSLDAALVYRSNALASPPILESCEIIALDDPLATATQPFAVALDTRFPCLAARLGSYLYDPSARARFEELGFSWMK
ncbi:MAG: substrate-binding domain-containing protein [Akkermansiaceae bacterium]|nr:substrate-binding domain-containing protein [Akkermansiaceae bacterium]